MVATVGASESALDTTSPAIVVSSDAHIGPRIEDLRPYCPAPYLEAFDEWAAEMKSQPWDLVEGEYTEERAGNVRRVQLNLNTAGHYDMHARLRDMNRDGVAAEAIFHSSMNNEPFPFRSGVSFSSTPQLDNELIRVGMRIYNRWLADACSIEPERHIGLAHVPTWDTEASLEEIEWARAAGLRGVNWPAPKPGVVEFDDPAWEPSWSACEALGMSLNTHVGAPIPGFKGRNSSPQAYALVLIESGSWPSRRGIGRMIFGGVFERHPNLKLVMTEQPGVWWPYLCQELDSVWMQKASKSLREQVPRKPSEYFMSNVFVGASFMAHFEAEAAVEHGFAANMIWGRDYPHKEGSWAYAEREDEPVRTRLALRDAFANLDPAAVKLMAGENALDVFNLDRVKLQNVANDIGAPTIQELTTPLNRVELDEVERILDPQVDYSFCFRKVGPWY